MLSKQSLRGNIRILVDDELVTKDQLISMSKKWTENQEILFRKLLEQGGKFRMMGKSFTIVPIEKMLNSKGELDSPIIPMDHDEDDVDQNYLR